MKEKEVFAQLRSCATGKGDVVALVRTLFTKDVTIRDKENKHKNRNGRSDSASTALLAVKTLQFVLSTLPKLKGSAKQAFLQAAEHTVEECVRLRQDLKLKTRFTVEMLYQKFISQLIVDSKFERSLTHIKALLFLLSPDARGIASRIKDIARLPRENEDKTVLGIFVFSLYNACRCLVETGKASEAVVLGKDELWCWMQKLETSRAAQYAKCCLSLFYSRAPAELSKAQAPLEAFESRKLGLMLSISVCGFSLCSKEDLVAKALKSGLSLLKEATAGAAKDPSLRAILGLYVEIWSAVGFHQLEGLPMRQLVVVDKCQTNSELFCSLDFITWFEHFCSVACQLRPVLGEELMRAIAETGKSRSVNTDAIQTCARLYLLQVNPKVGLKGLQKLVDTLRRLQSNNKTSDQLHKRVCKAFERLSSGPSVAALCRVPAFQRHILDVISSLVKLSEMANMNVVKAMLVFVQNLPAAVDNTRLKLETLALDGVKCSSEQLELVSTVCYNNGAKLYNASKFVEANAHFQVASRAMVKAFVERSNGHTWDAFVQLMKPERWQTLGLSYEKISNPCTKDALIAWAITCFVTVKETHARFFTKVKAKATDNEEDVEKCMIEVFSTWWEQELAGIPMPLNAGLVVRVARLECRAYKRNLPIEKFRKVTQTVIEATEEYCAKDNGSKDIAALLKLEVCMLAWMRYTRVRDNEGDKSEYYRSLLTPEDVRPSSVITCITNAWYSMIVEPSVEALEGVYQVIWDMKEALQSVPQLVYEEMWRCCASVVSFAKLHGHATLASRFLRVLTTMDEEGSGHFVSAASCFMQLGGDDSLASMMCPRFLPHESSLDVAEVVLRLREAGVLDVLEEGLSECDENNKTFSLDTFKRRWLRSLVYSLQSRHNLALVEAEQAFHIATKSLLQEGSVSRFDYWSMVLTAFEQLGYLWERRGDPRSSKYYYEQGCAFAERIHATQRVQVFRIKLAMIAITVGKPEDEVRASLPEDSSGFEWIVQLAALTLQNILFKSRGDAGSIINGRPPVTEEQDKEAQWWIQRYVDVSGAEYETLDDSSPILQRHEDFIRCLRAEALSHKSHPERRVASVYSDVLQVAAPYFRCRALYAVCLAKLQCSKPFPSSALLLLNDCVDLARKLCEPRCIARSHRLLGSILGSVELHHFAFAPALNLERSKKLEEEAVDPHREVDKDLVDLLKNARCEYWKHTKSRCSDLKLCLWSLYAPMLPYAISKQVLRFCLDRYLPCTWTTCSISVSDDGTMLYFTRERLGHAPLYIERHVGPKLVEWLDGFEKIVKDCEETTKGITADIAQAYTKEQKIKWWERRGRLDVEFQQRLVEFETECLGPCKLLLYPPPVSGLDISDVVASCNALLEAEDLLNERATELIILILEGHDQIPLPEFSSVVEVLLGLKAHPKLCSSLVEEMSKLYPEPKQRDTTKACVKEAAPQKQACDMLVKELRAELSHRGLSTRGLKKDLIQRLEEAREQDLIESEEELDNGCNVMRQSIIVILCAKLLPVPIESVPICSCLSITRMPSISFVLEHALRNRFQARERQSRKGGTYVVDPRGDLPSTRKTFEPVARRLRKRYGWSGVVSEKPSRELWEEGLKQSSVLLYCGHGAAEEIYSRERVSELTQCAVTLLMGCSSGKLLDQGEYEPSGVVWSYLLAGCPSLVCSLWDVTDQDIDRFTVKLMQTAVFDQSKNTLGSLIKDARLECKLRYLVGAAPVCYGVPLSLAK